MADTKKARGKSDRSRVSESQGYEVAHFAKKHGVTVEAAKGLIAKVGNARTKLTEAAKKLGKAPKKAVDKTATKRAELSKSGCRCGHSPQISADHDQVEGMKGRNIAPHQTGLQKGVQQQERWSMTAPNKHRRLAAVDFSLPNPSNIRTALPPNRKNGAGACSVPVLPLRPAPSRSRRQLHP